jgi:hemolysin III
MAPETIHPFFFRHPLSAGSHLLYCAWAVYATALLRRLCRGDPLRRASVTVFGATAVALYASSGLYHAVPADRPRLLAFLLRLDLTAIHFLIAGTGAPLLTVLLRGRARLVLLSLSWALSSGGALSVWLLPRLSPPLTLGLYASEGAVCLLPAVILARGLGLRPLAWLIGGAAVYVGGATCDVLRRPTPIPG